MKVRKEIGKAGQSVDLNEQWCVVSGSLIVTILPDQGEMVVVRETQGGVHGDSLWVSAIFLEI